MLKERFFFFLFKKKTLKWNPSVYPQKLRVAFSKRGNKFFLASENQTILDKRRGFPWVNVRSLLIGCFLSCCALQIRIVRVRARLRKVAHIVNVSVVYDDLHVHRMRIHSQQHDRRAAAIYFSEIQCIDFYKKKTRRNRNFVSSFSPLYFLIYLRPYFFFMDLVHETRINIKSLIFFFNELCS